MYLSNACIHVDHSHTNGPLTPSHIKVDHIILYNCNDYVFIICAHLTEVVFFGKFSDEVLRCFESYKLDDQKSVKQRDSTLAQAQQQLTYFAKYLTSEKVRSSGSCSVGTLYSRHTCYEVSQNCNYYFIELL